MRGEHPKSSIVVPKVVKAVHDHRLLETKDLDRNRESFAKIMNNNA